MRRSFVCSCLALSLVGCGGPKVADIGIGELSVSLLAVASSPEVASIRGEAEAGALAVKRAFVATSSFTFVPCTERARDIVLGANGYELIGPPLAGETVDTAIAEFCALELALAPLGDVAPSGTPETAAILIEATTGADEDIELIGSSESTLRLEAEAGQSFGERPLLLAFDVSTWLDGVPHESTDEAVEALEALTPSAVTLYEDTNGNHALDTEEMTPVATVR